MKTYILIMSNWVGVIIIFLLNTFSVSAQTGWSQVTGFGTNPGNLLMYRYVPVNILANAPLVIVLHGCTQSATIFETDSEWDSLAEANKFYVVHAEQQYQNNSSYCYNWFNPADYSRDQGEVYSVKQMVDYMKSQFSIDDSRVFTTGVSAGAGLSVALLGAYPEVFAAGSIMAGAPYKSATDALSAWNVMTGLVTKTATQWGDLVRSENPLFSGNFPKVAIFHGTSDVTVSPVNATELVKQWTNVHNTDQLADSVNSSFNGNSLIELKQYYNNSGSVVVQTYLISTMAHAIAVDPGSCFQQGGSIGTYAYDKNFYSTFWAAEFFGIIQYPYQISGPANVSTGQQNVVFSVPYHSGSSYNWSFPAGVSIVSGQGSNLVTVNWGAVDGDVSVTETTSALCKTGPIMKFVDVIVITSAENSFVDLAEISIVNDIENNLLSVKTILENYNVYIIDVNGKLIYQVNALSGNCTVNWPQKLNSGIYFVKIISGEKIFNRKYLKI